MEYICNNCPRKCNVSRTSLNNNKIEENIKKDITENNGFCKMPYNPVISRYSLHKWEEPCISGTNGSGTIFFTGCNLHCVYCQNYEISFLNKGEEVTKERLVEMMNELINQGAHNINFVTPSHYVYIIKQVLEENIFTVPIVYNCSGYEDIDALKTLDGLIDIYLTDLKYADNEIAIKYSHAPQYFEIATIAIKEMYRQTGKCIYDENGILQKGTIVRHLILPNNTSNTIKVLTWAKDNLPKDILISVMAQYIPEGKLEDFPELQRKINKIEYNKVLKFMIDNNIENGYIQDMESASKKYIPNF